MDYAEWEKSVPDAITGDLRGKAGIGTSRRDISLATLSLLIA
jgi:hypothetical protein